MATLTDEMQVLVVQRFATFVSASEIQRELKDLGFECSLQQLSYYNADLASSTDLSAKLRELFKQIRESFVRDTTQIAIAHKSYRLRELDDMARSAKKLKNFALAGSLMEQAAKEMGEAYTNKRVIEPADPLAALAAMLGESPDAVQAALSTIGDGSE